MIGISQESSCTKGVSFKPPVCAPMMRELVVHALTVSARSTVIITPKVVILNQVLLGPITWCVYVSCWGLLHFPVVWEGAAAQL